MRPILSINLEVGSNEVNSDFIEIPLPPKVSEQIIQKLNQKHSDFQRDIKK